jgi:hypothetical protein
MKRSEAIQKLIEIVKNQDVFAKNFTEEDSEKLLDAII